MKKNTNLKIKDIRQDASQNEFPWLIELRDTIENNAWHNNESTFTHTIRVVEKLEQILKKLPQKIKIYLDTETGKATKQDLLWYATLLHDCAKKETIKIIGNQTSFPNHEKYGEQKAKEILETIDLLPSEKETIVTIVKNHGLLHDLLNIKDETLEKRFEDIAKKYKDVIIYLILFTIADMQGSQLKENNKKEYDFRINFLQKSLKNYPL
jgi:UTP:GlnB (protein PII) uridylyltransferase